MADVPALVTLHVWRVPATRVPGALARMASDRLALRAQPGLRFAKSLGTGGPSFGPADATPTRWALLACWDSVSAARRFTSTAVARRWSAAACETARLDLVPLSSRGRWSGWEPFGEPGPDRATSAQRGPLLVLTRARLTAAKAVTFWRATPPVAQALSGAAGLRASFGVGEAPIGVQGTVSVWSDAAAIRRFAYDGAAHTDAIRRTPIEGWYAEELFARFRLTGATGRLDGRDAAELAA